MEAGLNHGISDASFRDESRKRTSHRLLKVPLGDVSDSGVRIQAWGMKSTHKAPEEPSLIDKSR